MSLSERTLLRLHIEAVWGVQFPGCLQSDLELSLAGIQPEWQLCAAEMAGDRVNIWRPDTPIRDREELITRANEALALPPTALTTAEISREIALQRVAIPTLELATAQTIAHPLTANERRLIEFFQPGYVEYHCHPDRRPLIGVVVAGKLLCMAHSSRRTLEACELGIDTLPEARRKGYALAATILWTEAVAREGLVPLYSAFIDNITSQRLAIAAGFRTFARVVTISTPQV